MEVIRKLEAKLNDVFTKQVPFQLPDNVRKGLANVLWLIALVVGVLQVLAAVALWQAGQRVNDLVDATNYLSRLYGTGDTVDRLGPFFYLTLVLLAVQAVLFLVAVAGLKGLSKTKGWDYLFYALLLSVVVGAFRVFSDVDGGVGYFLAALLGLAVGGYLLFQVRGYFAGVSTSKIGVSKKGSAK